MSHVFGEIRQVGYVTRDVRRSAAFLASTGIGPWFLAERVEMNAVDDNGGKVAIRMSVALANSGQLQLELIQPLDGDIGVYMDALKATSEEMAVHHYSSWPANLDVVFPSAKTAGFDTLFSGRTGFGPFAYFRHPERPSFIFECAELSPQRRSVFGQVAAAAEAWDGRDPVRIGWPPAMPG